MGKVYSCFQTKTAQKPLPDGAAHNYMAYVREYPPPLDFSMMAQSGNQKFYLVCVHPHGILFKILKHNNLADLKFPQEGSGKAGN